MKAVIGQNTRPLSLCLYPLLGSLNLTPNLTLGQSLNILPTISINLKTLLTTCGQFKKHKWFQQNKSSCLGSDLDDDEDDEDDSDDDHDDNPDHQEARGPRGGGVDLLGRRLGLLLSL